LLFPLFIVILDLLLLSILFTQTHKKDSHTKTHRDTNTDRQTYTHTNVHRQTDQGELKLDRQTFTHTLTQTDTHTLTQTDTNRHTHTLTQTDTHIHPWGLKRRGKF
jgi:hypothetical protein